MNEAPGTGTNLFHQCRNRAKTTCRIEPQTEHTDSPSIGRAELDCSSSPARRGEPIGKYKRCMSLRRECDRFGREGCPAPLIADGHRDRGRLGRHIGKGDTCNKPAGIVECKHKRARSASLQGTTAS
jgi:hypothetical protein